MHTKRIGESTFISSLSYKSLKTAVDFKELTFFCRVKNDSHRRKKGNTERYARVENTLRVHSAESKV